MKGRKEGKRSSTFVLLHSLLLSSFLFFFLFSFFFLLPIVITASFEEAHFVLVSYRKYNSAIKINHHRESGKIRTGDDHRRTCVSGEEVYILSDTFCAHLYTTNSLGVSYDACLETFSPLPRLSVGGDCPWSARDSWAYQCNRNYFFWEFGRRHYLW